MPEYKVYVDDNYHFMNEDERYLQGTYDSLDAAVAAAKKVIDRCFEGIDPRDKTPDQLFHGWSHMGDSPFIVTDDSQQDQAHIAYVESTMIEVEKLEPASAVEFLTAFDRVYNSLTNSFSASDYARQRCQELCDGKLS